MDTIALDDPALDTLINPLPLMTGFPVLNSTLRWEELMWKIFENPNLFMP